MSSRWVALWRSRGMIALLVNRDLRVRYSTSVLGYLWTILDPLLSALVYWFVFTVIFVRAGVGESPYIVFLLAGLLPWTWATSSIWVSRKSIWPSSSRSTSMNSSRLTEPPTASTRRWSRDIRRCCLKPPSRRCNEMRMKKDFDEATQLPFADDPEATRHVEQAKASGSKKQ